MNSSPQSLDAASEHLGRVSEGELDPRQRSLEASVNSFDVFDTLIARRCITPVRVFERMARESGIAGFVASRHQAEALVSHAPYTLDSIYAVLALLLGLSAEAAAALKDLEIRIEIDEAIPIAENLAAVHDGDLLLSDMYLPPEVIRRMLDKAGLKPIVPLIVTSSGKYSGRIWPEVVERFAVREHCGDHSHSDDIMPRRFGISSRPTAVATPNFVETTLIDIGLQDLAEIAREVRLASWSDIEAKRAVQIIQADLNLPLLVLGSVALVRYAERIGATSLLFSSRDCNLWLPIFEEVCRCAGANLRAEYFYTSRLTRTQPSAAYLSYARERMGDRTVVVDICGTGWSTALLAAHLGIRQPLFLLHRLAPVSAYESHKATPDTCDLEALVEGQQDHLSNMALEMCNYAEHGMVADVRSICGVPAPVFVEDRRPESIMELIEAQRDCARTATHIMARHGLRETLTLSEESLKTLFTALYGCLSQQAVLGTLFAEQHLIEDAGVMRRIANLE